MCAPQSEPSAFFLPLDTIVDSGRILRRPIDEWATEITARLRNLSGEALDLQRIRLCCSALNAAGLVFVYCGEPDRAEELCKSQLDWLWTFRGLFPAAELAVLAIHPWVNLGRLRRRSKDFHGALQYFCSINTAHQTRAVRFDRWECIPSDLFRQIAEPLCVYEVIRTHLQTGDLDEAIRFAAKLDEGLSVSASILKTELLMHIHLHSGDLPALLPLMKAMPWPRDRFGVLAKHYYSALALSALQQRHLSVKAIEKLVPCWVAYLNLGELDSRDLRLAIELCRLAKYLDCGDLFTALFSAAAVAVLKAREVPFASQLLQVGSSFAQDAGPARLQSFIQEAHYKTPPAASSTQAELRAVISQVLHVSEKALCA